MLNLSVIVLTGDEERHIARCLEKLAVLAPRQVFVVESQTGDRTHEIVESFRGATGASRPVIRSVFHSWEGCQAIQFNWALDNLPIDGEWVLRIDADEYIDEESVGRLKEFLNSNGFDTRGISGVRFELKRVFGGGEIRHGTNGIRQVRMFRRGMARYPDASMDERLVVDGEVIDLEVAFYDHSLMPISEWRIKHLGYAKREAAQAKASVRSGVWSDPRKAAYYQLPRYFRVVAYWVYRYLIRGGFLDGLAGWRWHFWQGLWYRWQVDRELGINGRNLI